MDSVILMNEGVEKVSYSFINISNTQLFVNNFTIHNQILPSEMPLFSMRFSETIIDRMFIMYFFF